MRLGERERRNGAISPYDYRQRRVLFRVCAARILYRFLAERRRVYGGSTKHNYRRKRRSCVNFAAKSGRGVSGLVFNARLFGGSCRKRALRVFRYKTVCEVERRGVYGALRIVRRHDVRRKPRYGYRGGRDCVACSGEKRA